MERSDRKAVPWVVISGLVRLLRIRFAKGRDGEWRRVPISGLLALFMFRSLLRDLSFFDLLLSPSFIAFSSPSFSPLPPPGASLDRARPSPLLLYLLHGRALGVE